VNSSATASRPIAPSYPQSPSDVAAHELASYVRRPAPPADQVDAAYVDRDRQRRAMVTAERAAAGVL
jgi:hypothetical protein